MVTHVGPSSLHGGAARGLFSEDELAGLERRFREGLSSAEILRLVQKQYVEEVETKSLFRDAINGMLGGLDPFSNYIPEDELDEFNKATRGKFGGIGIRIGMRKGLLTVISPLEGTPAYQAGVLAGDIIVEIDGKSTDGMRLDEAVKVLTGDPGTKVTITVRHVTGKVETITSWTLPLVMWIQPHWKRVFDSAL